MSVTSQPLPDSFLIVPNNRQFFGEIRNRENGLDIVSAFAFKDIAEIYLLRLGIIALRFNSDGPMRSIDRLQTTGPGLVPDYVMENHDAIKELQSRRLTFANFLAGALFGRLSAIRNSALTGAQYAGMDQILVFARTDSGLTIENTRYTEKVLGPKFRLLREEPRHATIIPQNQLDDAVSFVRDLSAREDEFQYASLQACTVMNYQAAILHSEQHAAASLALNFAVAEALIHEIFLAYGVVGGRVPKAFATRTHSVAPIGNGAFRRMKLADRLSALAAGNLMDSHLCRELDALRVLRNDLMHSAAGVSLGQSGTMQALVRDLWSYFLADRFELLSGWSMRI